LERRRLHPGQEAPSNYFYSPFHIILMGKRPVRAEDVGIREYIRNLRKRLARFRKEIRRKGNRDPRWEF
jgi:hypothetical protein